nr:hypothetical protein [uncultured Sphaerochaeta sp.]
MHINPTEREVLFGTPVIARQLQKYVEAKGTVGLDAICEVFSELPRRTIRNHLLQLCQRGAMTKQEGVYIASSEYTGIGVKADNAWRAARILSTFDPATLAKVSSIDREHSATLCRMWLKEGFLLRIGRNGLVPIYRLISKEVVRPIVHQER